jgi:ABC-type amino acid transport substrate-binding protein
VDFSAPYMTSQQFMLVRADEDRFATPADFAANPELLIGSQAGTSGFYTAVYDILDGDEANPRIKLFETFGASVQALIAGDVDMVLVDAASGRGYIGANPDALKIVGDAIKSDDFGFIFPPDSDLVEPFNAAIASLQTDGFFDYLNTKWFYLTDPNADDIYDALPDLGGRVVSAAMANDYTPLQFIDPATGEAVGWEYDAVTEICARLNCVVEWNNSSWDAMIAAINAGQFDIGMDGVTITAERAEQVDFSAPYMTSQQFMLVSADEDRFATPADFAANPELLIGSQAGTSGFYTAVYDILDGDEANPRIKLFETFGASVQALIAGDVDMVLVDAASGRGYIGANPDALKIVGDAIKSDDFGFIFPPDSDLVEPFNAAIASLQQDGFAEHLNTKWFFLYDPNR